MPWVRKRKVIKASTDARKAPAQGPYRCALGDGAFLTISAAMGTVYSIPADPQPRAIDLRPEAPGWERPGR
jgi:hypothetical protein